MMPAITDAIGFPILQISEPDFDFVNPEIESRIGTMNSDLRMAFSLIEALHANKGVGDSRADYELLTSKVDALMSLAISLEKSFNENEELARTLNRETHEGVKKATEHIQNPPVGL
jgi:hypothetical protein